MNAIDRRTYIGGPAAASIAGVNPYSSGVSLWQFLTGRQPPQQATDAMATGLLLETAVLDYAEAQLGMLERNVFLRDPDLPFLAGHLDALTADGNVVEAKTARSRDGWGDPGSNQVPFGYHVQALHYMALAKAQRCWMPVLFGGLTFAMYVVERDDELIQRIRDLCVRWWQQYVETDEPPPPASAADVALLFPRSVERAEQADDVVYAAYQRLLQVRHQEKTLADERDELEGRLKSAMLDAAVLLHGEQTLATWKNSSSRRFDAQAFKAAHPDLYAQFTTPTDSRRFLLKEMKP